MKKAANISTETNAVMDDLARFIRVIGGDPQLLRWFQSLEPQTAIQRDNEILFMAEKMASQIRYRDLAESFARLSHPEIFDAVSQILRAHGHVHQ